MMQTRSAVDLYIMWLQEAGLAAAAMYTICLAKSKICTRITDLIVSSLVCIVLCTAAGENREALVCR